MKSILLFSLALAMSLCGATTAVAGDGGFYIGTQVGKSGLEVDGDDPFSDEINFQLNGGYMFADWIGIDFGIVDYTAFEVDDSDTEVELSAFHIALLLRGPFYKSNDIYLKLGPTLVDEAISKKGESDTDDTESGLHVEIGLAMPVVKDFLDITLAWVYGTYASGEFFDDPDVDTTSINLGILFSF